MFGRKRIYLDAAAGMSGNPSSPHEEGRRSLEQLEGARVTIARLLEVKPDDVIFTGGATEANSIAIIGSLRAAKERLARPHAFYLPSSHASIVENMKLMEAEGVLVEPLPIKDAQVDIEELAKKIRPETVLISMDAVCGETGVIWNTREVAEILRKRETGSRALLHVDASQAPLSEKITRAHFGADMLVLDSSKISMTRGIGVLIAHRTIPLQALYNGGGQERGLCPGSESPELAEKFATYLCWATEDRDEFRSRAEKDRESLKTFILNSIKNAYIQEGKQQAPHILNVSLPGRDTDYLVALLDEAGYAVSTRSACESDSEEGSRAVLALTGEAEKARATLRISWGRDIRRSALLRFARILSEKVAFIDTSAGG